MVFRNGTERFRTVFRKQLTRDLVARYDRRRRFSALAARLGRLSLELLAASVANAYNGELAHSARLMRLAVIARRNQTEAAEAADRLEKEMSTEGITDEAEIKQTRLALGWTQDELAERAYCSRNRISQIENGDDPSPKLARLIALAFEEAKGEDDVEKA
jgi:DNA-binding XRE family transcriptional regulator